MGHPVRHPSLRLPILRSRLSINLLPFLVEPEYLERIGDDFEYPFEKLDRKAVLGEGEFGVVYRASALDISGNKGLSQVAVKILKGMVRKMSQEFRLTT